MAPHVAEALRALPGVSPQIIATSKNGGEHAVLGSMRALDVLNRQAVSALMKELQPTHVVHLAGVTAVTAAQADPETAWKVNLLGTLNLARAIIDDCPSCWLLNVGSGLVYGESARSGLALDEATLLAPMDEYAASKAAADLALGALVHRGLKCIRLRPFNHIGPGQSEGFAVPSFAMQIARVEAGLAAPVLQVGNLDAQRDFLDVRDVAAAYALVVRASHQLTTGLVLNIASGTPRRISEVVNVLMGLCRVGVTIEPNPRRMRQSDLPALIGDATKARELLHWAPTNSFENSLAAIMADCRARARAYRGG